MEIHLQLEVTEHRLAQVEGGVMVVVVNVVEGEVRGAAAGRMADQEEGCRISHDHKTNLGAQKYLRKA